MIALKILAIFFITIIIICALVKGLHVFINNMAQTNTNLKKLNNFRSEAYSDLYKALSNSSISLGSLQKIYHSLFFSAKDYFCYKYTLLLLSQNRSFWFSEQTATCLNEYIGVLEKKSSIYGLTEQSEDRLLCDFSTNNYDLFECYQNQLLKSIEKDITNINDISEFLSNKAQNSNSVDNRSVQKHLFSVIKR